MNLVLVCGACKKKHDGPCFDKSIKLSIRMKSAMVVDRDRDYYDYPRARDFVKEVEELEKHIEDLYKSNI